MAAASDEPRVMASSAGRRVDPDPDMPEDLEGLPGENVGSETVVRELGPLPTMEPRVAAFNVSFFVFYQMEKALIKLFLRISYNYRKR